MLKRIALLGLMVVLGAALSVPVFAAQAIQGSVGNVSAADGAALGQVGCRVYSTFGADAGINNNVASCTNTRCLRNYGTLGGFGAPGGYLCQGEGTAAYNGDSDGQTFYEIIDGQVNAGACNHAAFYSAQGQVASAVATPAGDFRQSGCPGASPVNCFERTDSVDARQTALANVNAGYQAAHSISSVGGLSPVPTVRVALPGAGCAAGEARLTWDDPETYAAAMKNGVASPVLGVRLYSNNSACSSCPGGDAGWTPGAAFAMGAGATGVCVPVSGDTWYALTVRFRGPTNNAASEIESGHVGAAGFVGANSQCVGNPATASRITNLSARYAGRGSVSVNWTTGTEGGIQAFYVTRGQSATGPFTRVSEAITPQGDGHTYSVNTKVHSALGRVQYYSIELVNADGTSEHSGPTAVSLPAAKRQLGAN